MNFNTLGGGGGGFRKTIFWGWGGGGGMGYDETVDNLGDHRKSGLFLGVISNHSRAFS